MRYTIHGTFEIKTFYISKNHQKSYIEAHTLKTNLTYYMCTKEQITVPKQYKQICEKEGQL